MDGKRRRTHALSSDYFIKDYGEDECCDEGAQYYRHAGLCLFHIMDVLNQAEQVLENFCLADVQTSLTFGSLQSKTFRSQKGFWIPKTGTR